MDQPRTSFSGNFLNLSSRMGKELILLKAKSHVCILHDISDKVCRRLHKQYPPFHFTGKSVEINPLGSVLTSKELEILSDIFGIDFS
jgi:hypothetical protein